MSELNQKEVNEQMYLFVKRWLEDLPFEESKKVPVMAIGYCLARLSKQDELLKEQEERKGNYVPCKVKTPTGKWNGEKCSVCGTEYIGSAPHQWKFCPDCGAKMEGR